MREFSPRAILRKTTKEDLMSTMEGAASAEAVEEFMVTVGVELGAAASAAMAFLGDRLGLYRALASGGGLTSVELASRTGCAERYVREWLCNQAAGAWVDYDEETERFSLPAAHAAVIAYEESPAFLGGSIQATGAIFRSLDMLGDAFRTGEGIGWGEHHSDLHEGAARFFKTACQALLPGWIEELDGVASRLRAGGRIADVGCGQGGAALTLAGGFSVASVVGIDSHGPSVDRARAAASASGVSDRVAFRAGRAEDLEAGGFDLVMMLDCLHDMGDPVAAASAACRALAEGGALLVVEPAAGDRLRDNFNPVGRMYYASSTAFCTPCALSQEGGWALGNQAGEARLRDVLSQGGFNAVRRVAATPYQLVLEARA
jgi:2-polyprenyl-3-methyl-5-hydroxy-6-metoxy-1,4-benzoquinol methylase